MVNRVGIVKRQLFSITVVILIRDTVGNGAGAGQGYFGNALGVLLREQKFVQHQRLPVLYLADHTRGVLARGSAAHRDRFQLDGIDAIEFVDDVQHVVAASFFAVGDDVDAGPVLILNGPKGRLVQQSREQAESQFLFAQVERKTKAVE